MFYRIHTPCFGTVIAQDLTAEEINAVREITRDMSRDEYAGYSPEEQQKLQRIVAIVGSKRVEVIDV